MSEGDSERAPLFANRLKPLRISEGSYVELNELAK